MSKLNFGKHKGKSLDEVPQQYLRWLIKVDANGLSSSQRKEINRILGDERDQLKERIREQAEEIARLERRKSPALDWWSGWYKKIVWLTHPDRGGQDGVMTLVNEADDRIRNMMQ